MDEALSTKVWMKSGAYLIIEPTEALTVIDVNTGKCVTGKNKQETIRKINLEAAKKQQGSSDFVICPVSLLWILLIWKIRDEQRLLETMREQLKYDPMKAAAVRHHFSGSYGSDPEKTAENIKRTGKGVRNLMINVQAKKENGHYKSFHINGHAMYAKQVQISCVRQCLHW